MEVSWLTPSCEIPGLKSGLKETKMSVNNSNGEFSYTLINRFKKKFHSDPVNKLALNAVTRGRLQEIAINRDVLNGMNFCFSHEAEPVEITDQKRSGTCWMFAELNWMRTFTRKKFNIKNIEFSENHLVFWDKLEKANYFLEQIIGLLEEDTFNRRLHHLLKKPTPDGVEWHMIMNLIKKYGLVPISVMPDTSNRENTRLMNDIVSYKLRESAAALRKMWKSGKSIEQIRRKKERFLEEIFRILAICLGVPPEKFDWSFRDKDEKFIRESQITPHGFYDKYVGIDLDDVYCLGSCPSSSTPYYKTYTVEFFNNMVGGRRWIWLNLPIRELKKCAVKVLKMGKTCLFGCDVLQESHSQEGLLSTDLFNYDLVFQTKLAMDKATRLDYGQTILTHSMVFAGVDIVKNRPVKWKVENSWGTKVGKKGYFIMSDQWFDEHVFNVIVEKEHLTARIIKLFEQEPVVLPPWHPMG